MNGYRMNIRKENYLKLKSMIEIGKSFSRKGR